LILSSILIDDWDVILSNKDEFNALFFFSLSLLQLTMVKVRIPEYNGEILVFIQRSTGVNNPVFVSDVISTTNGIIVTTKLQGVKEENVGNNSEFEELTGEGHPLGLFVLNIRERLIRLIDNRKV
jgi:hypothetical protein